MKRSHLIITATWLTLFMGTACKHESAENAARKGSTTAQTDTAKVEADHDEAGLIELTEAQYQAVGVKLGRLERRQMSQLIRVNGSLTVPPGQQVSIATPYGGILRSANLLAGTAVRRGQTLAILENPEFIRIQQEYLETISQLTYQQQEFERQNELSRENVGALKTLQQATAQLGTLRARAGGLRQQLAILGLNPANLTPETITRSLSVRAPIGGTLTQVNVNRGSFVAANDVLFEIMDTTGLLAELTVFEADLTRMQVGQRVRLSVVGTAGERMGRIKLINREVSPDRTVKVYASLDNPVSGSLRPGTFLKASIETGAATEPALPEAAVVQAGTSNQIFVFAGKESRQDQTHYRFRPVPVRAGTAQNGYRSVALPSGMTADAQVVLAGAYDILSASGGGDEGGGHDH
ncbi:efflux RND transporter periplasmic adaptor subunit [Fibrella forsythiae]|uniref:Efflux RND transporter periplasmic adaptor subunit n=1 Tax=Fibrella forsythiae TaxID=2817061 RepID=A0ABS3JN47_9BACT|nr:efflux RND transporter periplasmic adaptor subunit [Fibrella forsythiae]MBO0951408.1 efflux RND transporter periplasmic adaptor subunit [Fibrella forsythiae]